MSGAPAPGPEPATTRPARFAGSWYPGEAEDLRAELEAATPPGATPERARLVIAPHAGYRFSLSIAQAAYAQVEVSEVAVVLCPNHTVPPPIVSIWPSGAWETPLGEVPVDAALVERVLAECPGVVADTAAHLREHAVELHLPILRHRRPDVRVVPIVVAAREADELRRLGEGLARALAGRDDVLLVASTDMSHFEDADSARAKDELAVEHVLALDPDGLLETCTRERISMCGVRPTAAALFAARALGATEASLARYGHSGEVSGDHDHVVGYASFVVR